MNAQQYYALLTRVEALERSLSSLRNEHLKLSGKMIARENAELIEHQEALLTQAQIDAIESTKKRRTLSLSK